MTEEKKLQVWNKGKIVNINESKKFRKDHAGAWMRFDDYGKETMYGWEIDHRRPVSKGGKDSIDNLFPLQWKNNRTKADDYPNFKTSITSQGVENIEKENFW